MTGQQMINLWKMYSGKPDTDRTLVLLLLNLTQEKILQLVTRHYLHDLDEVDSSLSQDSDGRVDITSLSPRAWEDFNGIDFIRPKDSTLIQYTKISYTEYRKYIECGEFGNTMQPEYYTRGDYINCYPASSGQVLDIYYRKAPTTILDDDSTTVDFTTRIQHLIVKLACMTANKEVFADGAVDLREINLTVPATESNKFLKDVDNYGGRRGGGWIRSNPITTVDVIQKVLDGDAGIWQNTL